RLKADIALLKMWVLLVNIRRIAVSLAQRNAQHLAIKNIHILQSDWFSALAGQQFAMIVSNPPYIDEQDPHLQQGDVRFEPLTALVAEPKCVVSGKRVTSRVDR
ncbi:methyltransferase, partial [Escherichia sp. TWPC-MK]